MAHRIEVSADGIVKLPSEVIERHGLSEGGVMILDDRGGSIVMRTDAEVIADIQQWSREVLKDTDGFTVDDFIAERRREARRELSED